jgi:rubrerythrin
MRPIDEDSLKVRHGRWKDNGEDKFICSACKGYVYRWFGKSDFCPRCGARMDGGDDNA